MVSSQAVTVNEELYPRFAAGPVEAALTDTRVVVINGARQVGKSTLARLVAHGRSPVEVRFLDDAATRSAAMSDPAAFVRHEGLLVLDEVQRVPELMLAIKHDVDLDTRPGRFLLTGSARLLALQSIPDLLPGRSETVEMSPLTQGEIERRRPTDGSFVNAVFEEGPRLDVPPSRADRDEYLNRALRGGYPEAVRRVDPGRRARFFDAYVADLIARDVRQVSEIERPADLRRLLNLLAAQTATLVTSSAAANSLSVPASTVKRYLDLLETVYLVRRIPAWSTNLTNRAVATPKTIFADSGLAAHLAGMSLRRTRHPTAPVGPMMETFVLGELARQLAWTQPAVRLHHYRDRDDYEVDAVLEHPSGEIVAIEVKAAQTVRSDDFRGIRRLARRVGGQMVAGIVLYAGTQSLPFGERLRAWPISTLWNV